MKATPVPPADELALLSAAETARRVGDRSLSPVEVVDACLERIERSNSELNAFVTVLHARARGQAAAAERAVLAGEPLGPLHGVPVAVKDLSDHMAGVRNTYGSLPLKDHVAQQTSVHIARLERAGAIIIGKSNTPEFGHKGVTDNLVVGPTRNPFDTTQNAGGSSGGSAAAVAAPHGPPGAGHRRRRVGQDPCRPVQRRRLQADLREGSPTLRGRTRSAGCRRFSTSGRSHVTVEDADLLYSVLAGPHPRDPFSVPSDGHEPRAARQLPAESVRIAFTPNWGDFPVAPDVAGVVLDALSDVADIGPVEHVEVDLRRTHDALCQTWLRMSGLICSDIFETFAESGLALLSDHGEASRQNWSGWSRKHGHFQCSMSAETRSHARRL